MSDIITTLHSENDENTNLYPNIKKENIPNSSISKSKLSLDVLDILNGIDDRLSNAIASITQPKYYNTLPTNDVGLIVYSDGYIYSWNGSEYITTGIVYQATQIGDNSIIKDNMNNKFIDEIELLNQNNLINSPMLNDNTKFDYNSNYGTPEIVDVDDELCKGVQFGVSSNGANIFLYVPLSKIVSGEYVIRCNKISSQKVGKITLSVRNDTSYLGSIFTSDILHGDFNYDYNLNKEEILSTYPTATILAIAFSNGSATYGVTFYKPYFGLKNKYNDFYNIIVSKKENNVLKNKSIALDGDSICYGADYLGGYGKIIADNNNMTYTNQAVSGGTIATGTTNSDGTNRHWISTNIDNMPKNVDYVLIEGGFNDYANNVPLGTYTQYFDLDKNTYDTTTFYGALDYLFTSLVDEFVSQGVKIAFLIQHKINRIAFVNNNLNLTYESYYEAITKMCNKYAIPVIDLYKNSGFDTYFTSLKSYTYNNDGVHPTEDGYKKYYVDKITSFLKLL